MKFELYKLLIFYNIKSNYSFFFIFGVKPFQIILTLEENKRNIRFQ